MFFYLCLKNSLELPPRKPECAWILNFWCSLRNFYHYHHFSEISLPCKIIFIDGIFVSHYHFSLSLCSRVLQRNLLTALVIFLCQRLFQFFDFLIFVFFKTQNNLIICVMNILIYMPFRYFCSWYICISAQM